MESFEGHSDFWGYSRQVTQIFGDILGQRVVSIMLPVHPCPDVRVWRHSAIPRVQMLDLLPIFCPESQRSLDISWIWSLPIHPRVFFFLWKVAWRCLPTRSFLIARGLHLPPFCPACGADGESLVHVLFICPRS